jgi:hypothetical protein
MEICSLCPRFYDKLRISDTVPTPVKSRTDREFLFRLLFAHLQWSQPIPNARNTQSPSCRVGRVRSTDACATISRPSRGRRHLMSLTQRLPRSSNGTHCETLVQNVHGKPKQSSQYHQKADKYASLGIVLHLRVGQSCFSFLPWWPSEHARLNESIRYGTWM